MLATAENMAMALFQASHDCVKILDIEGNLTEMNPCGRALMEIDDFSSLKNRSWSSFWPEPAAERVRVAIADAGAGKASHFDADCPTAKGTPKHWEVTVLPIVDGSGAVVRIVASSRDITGRKAREDAITQRLAEQQSAMMSLIGQLEAERRRSEESRNQISHAEKLKVLGRLVGSVVHDINNVLASMAGAARLLRRRADDARTKDILDHVDQAVDRGTHLVRQLLDFSRAGETGSEPLDIAAALSADAPLLHHLVGRAIDVAVDVEEGIWPVLVAPARLQSVLFNLVANSRDALGERDGHIRIRARNRPSIVRPAGLPPGDYVEIAVIDDGPGIPPEVVARLGEPFFTTKGAGKGTGLGIPSAFDLAEQSGGRVEIDSRVGSGTRISLHLPRSGAAGAPVDTPDGDIDPSLHGGATILVVENEAVLRTHLAEILRGLGYTVIEAQDRATAEAAFVAGLAVDILLSDLHLGHDSGVEIAKSARRASADLPIVFLSGTWGMGVPLGEIVLRKPVNEAILARTVLEQLGRVPASHLTREALRTSDRVRDRIRDDRVRALYDAWRQEAGNRGRLPSVEHMSVIGHDLHEVRYLVELGGTSEMPSFVFREAGRSLSVRLGRELVDTVVTSSDHDVLGSLGRTMRRVSRGVAWFDYARMNLGSGTQLIFERLLLPLSRDGEHVTHLVGVALFDELKP